VQIFIMSVSTCWWGSLQAIGKRVSTAAGHCGTVVLQHNEGVWWKRLMPEVGEGGAMRKERENGADWLL
jgi:hypothetical protein